MNRFWKNHCRVCQGGHLRHFFKKWIFWELIFHRPCFHFLCFKHHWCISSPYFCIAFKYLIIEFHEKQDKIAQSIKWLTRHYKFFSCTGCRYDISLIFWTVFEICKRANISIWLIKWKNRRLWSQCVLTHRPPSYLNPKKSRGGAPRALLVVYRLPFQVR